MLTVKKPNQVSFKPEDFDPPLKRKKPTIPDYWTLEEISQEIGLSTRKVNYDIVGRPELRLEPSLKAYRVGKILLVRDEDALEYIYRLRETKKRKKF